MACLEAAQVLLLVCCRLPWCLSRPHAARYVCPAHRATTPTAAARLTALANHSPNFERGDRFRGHSANVTSSASAPTSAAASSAGFVEAIVLIFIRTAVVGCRLGASWRSDRWPRAFLSAEQNPRQRQYKAPLHA